MLATPLSLVLLQVSPIDDALIQTYLGLFAFLKDLPRLGMLAAVLDRQHIDVPLPLKVRACADILLAVLGIARFDFLFFLSILDLAYLRFFLPLRFFAHVSSAMAASKVSHSSLVTVLQSLSHVRSLLLVLRAATSGFFPFVASSTHSGMVSLLRISA